MCKLVSFPSSVGYKRESQHLNPFPAKFVHLSSTLMELDAGSDASGTSLACIATSSFTMSTSLV